MKYLVLLFFSCITLTGCSLFNQEEPFQKSTEANKLLVSAAASLADALPEVITAFEEEYPNINITVNYGGSGQLSRQIQQGAPVDIFLSANQQWMDTLTEEKLIAEDTRTDVIGNHLVLIGNKQSSQSKASLQQLSDMQIDQIAIGNPESVPAGIYAKTALQNSGVWQSLEEQFVYAKDVRQALTYVESGNTELGFVYASDAAISKDVRIITEVDETLYPAIVYPAGVTSYSTNRHDAETFIHFLKQDKAAAIFKSYGFRNIH